MKNLNLESLDSIQDLLVLKSNRHQDHRGYTHELTSSNIFFTFTNSNICQSNEDVLRGLYFSTKPKQIQPIKGLVYLVVVDLRPESISYLKKQSFWLDGEKVDQIRVLIPGRCAYGTFSKTDNLILYLNDDLNEIQLNPFDENLNIEWPKPLNEYILSQTDRESPMFDQIKHTITLKYNFLLYGSNGYLQNNAIKILNEKKVV